MGLRPPLAGTVTLDGDGPARPDAPRRSCAPASATCPRTAASTAWSRSSPSRRTWCWTCTTGRRSATRFALTPDAIAASAQGADRAVRRPDLVGRRAGRHALRRQPAEGRSWPGRCPGRCKLFIAAQPTRGVDVGSIEFIHSRIMHERDIGTAVLVVSSELDEVIGAGRPDRGDVPRPDHRASSSPDTPREEIGLLMAGITDAADAATTGRRRATPTASRRRRDRRTSDQRPRRPPDEPRASAAAGRAGDAAPSADRTAPARSEPTRSASVPAQPVGRQHGHRDGAVASCWRWSSARS